MPVLDILKENNSFYPLPKLLSIMTFPDDAKTRSEYLAQEAVWVHQEVMKRREKCNIFDETPSTLKSHGSSSDKSRTPSSGFRDCGFMIAPNIFELKRFSELLLSAPSKNEMESKFWSAWEDGMVSGEILMLIYEMTKHELSGGASVNKAVFILEGRLKDGKRLNGKKLPSNHDYIRKVWSRYQPVSHLWASAVTFLFNNKITNLFGSSYQSSLPEFLSCAEEFRKFGISYVPRAQANPLLDPNEAYTIPQEVVLPKAQLYIPSQYKNLIPILEEYRVPERHYYECAR